MGQLDMSKQTTIQLQHRYPTAKLARESARFLPSCDWEPVERDKWFYLQFRCEVDKAHRIVSYLRRDYPAMKFAEVDSAAPVTP
jgi:hypothetical protein